jgi:hypothetical protein
MQIISFIFGLLAIAGAFVAVFPLLGWVNWLNIPFAIVGLILGLIAITAARDYRGFGIAGVILCTLAIIFGALKLKACGGFI